MGNRSGVISLALLWFAYASTDPNAYDAPHIEGASQRLVSFEVVVDKQSPYTVSFAPETDPHQVAAAFLNRTGMAGSDVAAQWAEALAARARQATAAAAAASTQTAAAVEEMKPPKQFTVQFTADGDPLEIAKTFLASTGQDKDPLAEEWARTVADAVQKEQLRMRMEAAGSFTSRDELTSSLTSRSPAVAVGGFPEGSVPENHTLDVNLASSLMQPLSLQQTVDVSASQTLVTAENAAAAVGTAGVHEADEVSEELDHAPFDCVIPISVEVPHAATTNETAAESRGSSSVHDYDVLVKKGQLLRQAAHAFCAQQWNDVEPALRELLTVAGVDSASLSFPSGESPYGEAIASLPPGSEAAQYWADPGRQVLFHYCSTEVKGLMLRWIERRTREGQFVNSNATGA